MRLFLLILFLNISNCNLTAFSIPEICSKRINCKVVDMDNSLGIANLKVQLYLPNQNKIEILTSSSGAFGFDLPCEFIREEVITKIFQKQSIIYYSKIRFDPNSELLISANIKPNLQDSIKGLRDRILDLEETILSQRNEIRSYKQKIGKLKDLTDSNRLLQNQIDQFKNQILLLKKRLEVERKEYYEIVEDLSDRLKFALDDLERVNKENSKNIQILNYYKGKYQLYNSLHLDVVEMQKISSTKARVKIRISRCDIEPLPQILELRYGMFLSGELTDEEKNTEFFNYNVQIPTNNKLFHEEEIEIDLTKGNFGNLLFKKRFMVLFGFERAFLGGQSCKFNNRNQMKDKQKIKSECYSESRA